jgi:hypothetical protein
MSGVFSGLAGTIVAYILVTRNPENVVAGGVALIVLRPGTRPGL